MWNKSVLAFTLKQKLFLVFLTINVLMMLGGAVALYQFAVLHSYINQTTATEIRQLELSEGLLQDTALVRYHGRRFLDLGATEDRNETLARIDTINKKLQLAKDLFASDPEHWQSVAALHSMVEAYGKQFDLTSTRLDSRIVKQMDILKDVETIETHLREFFSTHPGRNEVLQPFLFFMTAKLHLNSYFYSFDDQDLLEVSRSLDIIENLLGTHMSFLSPPQERMRQAVATEVNRFVTTLTNFHVEVQQQRSEEKERLAPLPEQMLKQATLLSAISWEQLQEMINQVSQQMSRSRWQMLIVLFFTLGLGCVLPFLFTKSIVTPIAEMARAASKIADGDIDQHIRHRSTDEIGILASAFQRLIEYIRGIASAADQISKGELTVQLTPRSERDVLSQSFQRMVTNLGAMNGKMQEGATILTSAIQNIITMTSQVTSNVTEAATAVTQMVTTAEETKHTAHLVGQRAKEISSNAQHTAEISQLGQDAVEKALTGMQHIRQQMESIAHSIVRLSEQSQTISTILNSVNELTEQSNLLAINAEIEAAKAGEQGKGFAVVAQEVKNLAAQSKSATAKVRLLLNDIHSAVQTAVAVTAQGTKAVDAGVKQSLDAGESIRALSQSINEAALAMSQIVASSQQQALGMDQVVLAIASIRQATAQNTDGIKRIDREAQGLYMVGQTLKELTNQYVIADTGGGKEAAGRESV